MLPCFLENKLYLDFSGFFQYKLYPEHTTSEESLHRNLPVG